MWFKKDKKEQNKAENEKDKIVQIMYENFKVGDQIEYLGVKMIVTGYNHYVSIYNPILIPGVETEWMDGLNRLQNTFLVWWKADMCKKISQ